LAEIFERSGGMKVERMTAAEGVAHAYRCEQKTPEVQSGFYM
jgi:hypothetical protein